MSLGLGEFRELRPEREHRRWLRPSVGKENSIIPGRKIHDEL